MQNTIFKAGHTVGCYMTHALAFLPSFFIQIAVMVFGRHEPHAEPEPETEPEPSNHMRGDVCLC